MKIYLQHFVKQLRNYSLSLDKTSILIDKPWAMIDEEFELQKLIFKKNKELIMSKNGQVTIGKWDYFPEAKSLLIDRNKDKILCNEGFIDKGVMILKLDGTNNKFFMLANENIVPDLDADRYLKQLRYQKLKISIWELIDGRLLEVQQRYGSQEYEGITENLNVYFEGNEVENGKYPLKSGIYSLLVNSSKIAKIYINKQYELKNGLTMFIEQQEYNHRNIGDKVFINDLPAPDGKYKLGLFSSIKVKDGQIV